MIAAGREFEGRVTGDCRQGSGRALGQADSYTYTDLHPRSRPRVTTFVPEVRIFVGREGERDARLRIEGVSGMCACASVPCLRVP